MNPIKQALIIIAAYLVAETFLVACAYLWVFIYSMLIYSGGDSAYYEAYAQVASPVVAVALAGPVFFAIGRAMRRRWSDQAQKLAIGAGVVNFVVSVPLVVTTVVDDLVYNLLMVVLATLAMLAGAYVGTRSETVPTG